MSMNETALALSGTAGSSVVVPHLVGQPDDDEASVALAQQLADQELEAAGLQLVAFDKSDDGDDDDVSSQPSQLHT